MYSRATFSMFEKMCSRFVMTQRIYLDKKEIAARFKEAASMFLKKQKMHLIYPFSWIKEPKVFNGMQYEAMVLHLKFKTRFWLSAKNCGEVKYVYQKGGRGFIEWIDVHAQWRKKGLGYVLMQAALAEMDKAQVKTVESFVSSNNRAAEALHEKFGFVFKDGNVDGLHVEQRVLPVQDSSSKF